MEDVKWFPGPLGRSVAVVQAHGGPIMLHAWMSGKWMISRGTAESSPYSQVREEGNVCDFSEAKKVAEIAARNVAESERPKS